MKNIHLIIVLILFSTLVNAQIANNTSDLDKTKVFVRVQKLTPTMTNILGQYGEIVDQKYETIKVKNLAKSSSNIIDINWVVLSGQNINLNKILKLDFVQFAAYFKKGNSKSIGQTGLIYAKIKEPADTPIDLSKFEHLHHVKVVDRVGYQQNILKILVNKSNKKSLEVLKELIQSQPYIEWVQISYLYSIQPTCTVDPLVTDQWGLNNSGQEGGTVGVDINYCASRFISTGDPNIVVAVVDEGVDLVHPDLQANIVAGFDATGGNGNGAPANNGEVHGTLCAGIIAAIDNNNIGITGVAPNCRIMPCKIDYSSMQALEEFADAIDFAWMNGADVISNSWEVNAEFPVLTTAIENALTLGRDGLGCVVVFSTANDGGGTISFPALTIPNILTVGAINRFGNRTPISQFGQGIDVVAPGQDIMTTDITGTGDISDDYTSFSGTSAAAPHVAGLAALILSENPCLTEEQVRDIIEGSCQKLPGYSFTSTTGRPNGEWNNELGYGLIDAEAALERARTLFLQDRTETSDINHFGLGSIIVGTDVHPNINIQDGDYIVTANADVDIKAEESIDLMPNVDIAFGSEFTARIDNFNGNCATWNSSFIRPEKPEVAIGVPVNNHSKQATPPTEISQDKVDWIVYPNPFQDRLNIKFNALGPTTYTLNLYSALGQLALQKNGSLEQGEQNLSIHTNELTNGVYLLQLHINEKILTKKIIHYEN